MYLPIHSNNYVPKMCLPCALSLVYGKKGVISISELWEETFYICRSESVFLWSCQSLMACCPPFFLPPPFFFWQWKVLNFLLRTPPLGRVAHTRYLGLVTVIYIFSFNSASSRVVFILKGGGGDKEAWESVASLLDWFPSVCGGCPLCEACVFPYPIVVTIKKGSVCLGILAVLCQQLDLAIG